MGSTRKVRLFDRGNKTDDSAEDVVASIACATESYLPCEYLIVEVIGEIVYSALRTSPTQYTTMINQFRLGVCAYTSRPLCCLCASSVMHPQGFLVLIIAPQHRYPVITETTGIGITETKPLHREK